MKKRSHARLWSGTIWLAGLVLLALILPALPAGKSPGDCKAEDCKEWDESAHDCVDMPKDCWKLKTVPAGSLQDCSCSGGFCNNATVATYPYLEPEETCKGSPGYFNRGVQLVATERPCELEPDTEALAGAYDSLKDCCADSPGQCVGNTLASIAIIAATIESGGTVAMAIAALGADSVADMLLSLCTCISCSPCDYVKCSVSYDHGLPHYDVEPWPHLTAGECP